VRFKSLAGLAARGIVGSPFRSWLIGFCALAIAGFVLSTVLVVRGAQQSLHLAMQRLGADIVVVPQGAETKVQGALLMGTPSKAWMPASDVQKIAAVRGVAAASPQLYLESLSNASCCSVSDMFMVAFDPKTDFTLEPWLKEKFGSDLSLGQAVGGKYVFVPEGQENIKLYGYILTLRANLEPTGTNLDQSLFVTFDTAYDMARISRSQAEKPLVIPRDSVSSVMVKLSPGADAKAVAVDILHEVPNVTPILSPDMFGAYRAQISGLLRGTVIVLVLVAVLALALMALIFSMAVHERRRQIGVLRALGATRGAVLLSLLTEALLLALAGGLVGVVLASVGVYLFRTALVSTLGFPFLFPPFGSLAALVAAGLALALICVALAALVPALRISRQEPANSMRE
jgi:putative ABC transport system permease protein